MKKILIATAVAMTLSATAHAVEGTAQLKVIGTLTNDACTPEMSDGGVVDFGTHYVDTLSATETNQLGKKDFTLTIKCDSPSKVGWSITDQVADTAASVTIIDPGWNPAEEVFTSGGRFGVGKTAGQVNIGAYAVTINKSGITADGKVVTAISGDKFQATSEIVWTEFQGGSGGYDYVGNSGSFILSVGEGTGTVNPTAFTTAVFPMRIGLAVQKTSTLAITDNTPIVGAATITLHYL